MQKPGAGLLEPSRHEQKRVYSMTYATDLRAARASSLDRTMSYRTDLRARIEKYNVYRSTLRELSQLNDRDLAELGLDRSMIRNVAMQAAYGN